MFKLVTVSSAVFDSSVFSILWPNFYSGLYLPQSAFFFFFVWTQDLNHLKYATLSKLSGLIWLQWSLLSQAFLLWDFALVKSNQLERHILLQLYFLYFLHCIQFFFCLSWCLFLEGHFIAYSFVMATLAPQRRQTGLPTMSVNILNLPLVFHRFCLQNKLFSWAVATCKPFLSWDHRNSRPTTALKMWRGTLGEGARQPPTPSDSPPSVKKAKIY